VAVVLDWLGFGSAVYHEHDAPEAAAPDDVTRFMRLVQWARQRIANRAAICIVPNARRAEAFTESTHRDNVLVVWNAPLGREVRPEPATAEPGRLRVVYHGSIVPARLPEAVLEAVAQVEGASLLVIGYDPAGGGYLERLRAKAIECRLGTRVQFLAARPRHDLLRVAATCDVGLALIPLSTSHANEQTMDGASNKPFDYLACGLAVLVSDRREWRSLIVEPGYGLSCDPGSVASLVGALTWFLSHPVERRRMAGAGQERVRNEWNYERAFSPVIGRLMGGTIAGSIASPMDTGDVGRVGGH
jgi:glycosyltransferase involved in cell wall biosynthesis